MENPKIEPIKTENAVQRNSRADFLDANGIDGFYDPFDGTEEPDEVILYEH